MLTAKAAIAMIFITLYESVAFYSLYKCVVVYGSFIVLEYFIEEYKNIIQHEVAVKTVTSAFMHVSVCPH